MIIGSHYDGVDDDVFFIGDWEHGMLLYYINHIYEVDSDDKIPPP